MEHKAKEVVDFSSTKRVEPKSMKTVCSVLFICQMLPKNRIVGSRISLSSLSYVKTWPPHFYLLPRSLCFYYPHVSCFYFDLVCFFMQFFVWYIWILGPWTRFCWLVFLVLVEVKKPNFVPMRHLCYTTAEHDSCSF